MSLRKAGPIEYAIAAHSAALTLAREKKARKLTDVLDAVRLEPGHDFDPELLLLPDKVGARRLVEQEAGVNPASEETWRMVVGLLREREAARRLAS